MQASKSLCSLEASVPLSGGRMQLRSVCDSRMLCSIRTCMKLARMWKHMLLAFLSGMLRLMHMES